MDRVTNVYVNDEVGRKYRVAFSEGGHPLVVARRCLKGGRETLLRPSGPKGRLMVAKAREKRDG